MPRKTKPTSERRFSILTNRQRKMLDDAPVIGTSLVEEHERVRRQRTIQQRKNRRIDDFAYRYCSQMDRHGVTTEDIENTERLISMLGDTVLIHKRKVKL